MLADARDESKLWLGHGGGGGGDTPPPPYSRSEFLSLNTIDLLGQIILFSCHRMFSHIPRPLPTRRRQCPLLQL